MAAHPGAPPERYRFILHKEALWSSFLCFGVAAIVDRLPWGPWLAPAQWALCLALLAVGWGACVQYWSLAVRGVRDASTEGSPLLARVGGAVAMLGTVVAVVLLLVGTGAAVLSSLLW